MAPDRAVMVVDAADARSAAVTIPALLTVAIPVSADSQVTFVNIVVLLFEKFPIASS